MSDAQQSRSIIAIAGPTASGKSELGIVLALKLSGEIINCDSVQVYQQIQIATAKVPESERGGIPHHLIDFIAPEVNYTAGQWAQAAAEKVEEIQQRGHLPILVGGTGFYLRALRRPFFPSPPTDLKLRRRLNRLRERHGPEWLHRLLQRLDPQSATQLFPRDWPRVQRAIEVRLQTGRTMSTQKLTTPRPGMADQQWRVFALNPPRRDLYQRIDQRTASHYEAGLVAEVQSLLEAGVPAESNALGAHGYRRVVEYLQGHRSLESALEQTRLDVRHYAKRQLTWFRREPDVEWIDGFGDDPRVQQEVLAAISGSSRRL